MLGNERVFYLPFAVEEGLFKITQNDSPLKYNRQVLKLSHFCLNLKDHRLPNFIYQPVDPETRGLSEDYLNEIMKFQPKSGLYTIDLEAEQEPLLKAISSYFHNKGINFHLTWDKNL